MSSERLQGSTADPAHIYRNVSRPDQESSPFDCDTCQDEGVIWEPDPKEAPTYESGPWAVARPCPDCTERSA